MTLNTTREAMAHQKLAEALVRVREAEQEAEKALSDLEDAIREQKETNRIEINPELTPGFQHMWQDRRVRLLVESQ